MTLHGQSIEKIEVVGHVCRELQILYLQNNVISRIEDLHHLKAVFYHLFLHLLPPCVQHNAFVCPLHVSSCMITPLCRSSGT